MQRKPIDLNSSESEKDALEALRAELESRASAPSKAFTEPFVAHGKPPSIPPVA